MKMFEKEAKERAKDFTDNKERQAAYECGFLDGADRATEELKEKLAGAERTRDNLRQIGFPTFQSCKEYADKMNYAKEIIKDLLDNSDEYAKQRAIDFLKEE
jgi:hypothetical protein